jgi:uncharacterized hydrophobic protein (TIGR00341 family)
LQIVHATFSSGEGKEAVKLIENLGMEIEDYKLIESDSGDLLIINLLYDKVDIVIDKLKGDFDFTNNVHRSLMIFTPDTIIPRNKEKANKESYRASRETIVDYAKENSALSMQLIFLAIVASIVTSLGLITNNTAVIVGSMIIAPVFGPIAAMAIGIVLGDLKLLGQGLLSELTVVGIAIIVGGIFGVIIPNVTLNSALEVRMLPTIADLLIAFAAGGAGAYSLIVHVKSQQLVGVVIAAALIPVMATIGIGISLGNISMIIGATLLLLGNFFALLLAIILVFYYQGLKPQWWYASTAKKLIKRSLIVLVISVVVLTVPLSAITYQQMIKEQPEDIVRKVYRKKFSDQLDSRLVSIDIDTEQKEAVLVLYTSSETSNTYFNSLTEEIKARLGSDYNLIFEVIPTKIIRPNLSED